MVDDEDDFMRCMIQAYISRDCRFRSIVTDKDQEGSNCKNLDLVSVCLPAKTVAFLEPGANPYCVQKTVLKAITSGKASISFSVDLHGMTQGTAEEKLTSTLLRCWKNGERLVLVVTGVGKMGIGILRNKLPSFLNGSALKKIVMFFCQAQQKHGGCGAFYVYLRRYS